jgi:hypothetical protein
MKSYKNVSHTFILKGHGRWSYGEVLTRDQIKENLVGRMPTRGGLTLDERTDKVIADLLYQKKIEEISVKKKKGDDKDGI